MMRHAWPVITLGALALVVASCGPVQVPARPLEGPLSGAPGQEQATLPQRGAVLYRANCEVCHGGATGGQMMDYPPRHNASGHTWHHPDCQLKDIIWNGAGEMGEMMRRMMGVREDVPRMPAFKDRLTREDVAAILAYIKTWWTDQQREFQARVTREAC